MQFLPSFQNSYIFMIFYCSVCHVMVQESVLAREGYSNNYCKIEYSVFFFKNSL